MANIFYLEEIGKAFVPKKIIPNLRSYLLKAGITKEPYKFFGILFWLTFAVTATTYIIYIFPFLSQKNTLILFIGTLIGWAFTQLLLALVLILSIHFYLDIQIYKRTKQMEELLPDFLTLVSSNLRGGMAFEHALWSAIKPRFSVLAREMEIAAKKVMTGEDTQNAIGEFSLKYNSPMLRRSMELVISELESGGNIAHLIDKIVENLKKTKELKADMAASALTYIIFISIIVIAIAPLLFALSAQLITIIGKFSSKLAGAPITGSQINISFSDMGATKDGFKIFSIVGLGIISTFASMIVSIVEKGDIKGGLKYIPLFSIGSILFYLLFIKILSSLFSNIV